MKSTIKDKVRYCKFFRFTFLLLMFNFLVKAKGEDIVHEGPLPLGGEVKKEGSDIILSLKQPNAVRLVLKEIAVEAKVLYKLSFRAKISDPGNGLKFDPKKNGDFPSWEIRIKDAEGRLPYEGHLRYTWQRCFSSKWRTYQQRFYTPATGKTLQLIISNGFGKNSLLIRDIKLEKVISENILINSDFAGGNYDYSGWNELSRAKLIKANDKTMMQIEAGGYALSDPVPILPGSYLFSGMAIPEHFFYDADMIRIDYKQIRKRNFSVPKNAAYLRFFFSSGKISTFSLERINAKRK